VVTSPGATARLVFIAVDLPTVSLLSLLYFPQ